MQQTPNLSAGERDHAVRHARGTFPALGCLFARYFEPLAASRLALSDYPF